MSTIVSRRRFAQLLGAGAVLSVARPALSFAKPVVAAPPHVPATSGVVRLSSNENPYGPSPKALKAMNDVFNLACRYPDEHNDLLIDAVAKLNGVNHDQILLGDGSSEILQLCADTFTGPGRGNLVAADPTFEAILNNASVNGAEVVKVPLTPTFSHDLAKMTTAAKQGLIYVCNPNNPTASITNTACPRRRRMNASIAPLESHCVEIRKYADQLAAPQRAQRTSGVDPSSTSPQSQMNSIAYFLPAAPRLVVGSAPLQLTSAVGP